MIRVGLTDADSELGGELLRLLLNHPDVEIVGAYSESNIGKPIPMHHHGMIGETELQFSERLNPEELDVIFLCGQSDMSKQFISLRHNYPELKLVDLCNYKLTESLNDFSCGISELNRKELVREANSVYILPPVSTIMAVGLYPLAANLLLNSDIKVEVDLPKQFLDNFNCEENSIILKNLLSKIQNSFSSEIYFTKGLSTSRRGVRISFNIPTTTNLENIMQLYENIYDDHNFTYMTNRRLELKEVVGTHKILITLQKIDSENLHIELIADYLMRGAAGEAIHVMNLLFGLHERTGLSLKASSV